MSWLGGMMAVLAAAESMPAGPGTNPLAYTVAAYGVVSTLLWGGLLVTMAGLRRAQRKVR